MAGNERTCRFYLLRYTPNIVRGEFVNIGVLLHEPGKNRLYAPRLLEDFRRVRRIHPWADLDVLAALGKQIESESVAHPGAERYLDRLSEASNALEVAEPRAVLTSDPEAELERLFDTYVREPHYPSRVGAAVERSRAWIRSNLNAALRRAGLWHKLERQVPVTEFTHPGDRFKFDFGYRRNGDRGFLQAVALDREVDRSKILAYTMERIATRLAAENYSATCTAVVEELPAEGNETAQLSARILTEQEIALVPVAGLDDFLDKIGPEIT